MDLCFDGQLLRTREKTQTLSPIEGRVDSLAVVGDVDSEGMMDVAAVMDVMVTVGPRLLCFSIQIGL